MVANGLKILKMPKKQNFNFLILPPSFLPTARKKKGGNTEIAVISPEFVRIKYSIPFFWLTFDKESANVDYFIKK